MSSKNSKNIGKPDNYNWSLYFHFVELWSSECFAFFLYHLVFFYHQQHYLAIFEIPRSFHPPRYLITQISLQYLRNHIYRLLICCLYSIALLPLVNPCLNHYLKISGFDMDLELATKYSFLLTNPTRHLNLLQICHYHSQTLLIPNA